MDARFGLIYTGFILSFVTASTVTFADLPQVKALFPSFPAYFIVAFILGGFVASPLIGYLHRKYQNPTDIRLANGPLFDQIRKIVREELDRDKNKGSASLTDDLDGRLKDIDDRLKAKGI